MDFFFGCWSSRRSSVDCRDVTERMSGFFRQQAVPFGLFVSQPHFAVGIASFATAQQLLGKRIAETEDAITVGDAVLYGGAGDGCESELNVGVPAALLRLAAARSDEGKLAALNGDFAVAILDKKAHALTLVRDHCGIAPLHYSQHRDACAFSSLVRPLLLTPWAKQDLDPIALASFLLMMAPGRERTYFKSVHAVLPASRVVLAGSEEARSTKFWFPEPARGVVFANANEAYEAVRAELVRSTIVRMRGEEAVGVKLSGGLDSSTVAGIACASFPERRIVAVTAALPIGSTNPISDEREFVEELGQRYQNLEINYETAEGADPLMGTAYWSTWTAGPVSDAYYYLESSLAQTAVNCGVRGLLSGDGGDYCVSARAGAYLAECLIGMRPAAFAGEFMRVRRAENLGPVRVVRHVLLPYVVPQRVLALARRWRRGPWHHNHAIAPALTRQREFLEHFQECNFHEVSTTTVHSVLENEKLNLSGLDCINPSLERMLLAPRGLGMRYPLFDRRLIEVAMAVPSRFKIAEGLDRALIRQAGGPFLPRKIAQRPRKGWFSPDFERRFLACADRLESGLERASRNELYRSLVDVDKVRAALPLLRQPPSVEYDLRLASHIHFPYRLARFIGAVLE